MNLVRLSLEYGVKNLRFFIPMSKLHFAGFIPGIALRYSSDATDIVECVVDESRYQVVDNYKITLQAIDKSYGNTHFYQSDLESIMRDNPEEFKVRVLTIDGYFTPKEIE